MSEWLKYSISHRSQPDQRHSDGLGRVASCNNSGANQYLPRTDHQHWSNTVSPQLRGYGPEFHYFSISIMDQFWLACFWRSRSLNSHRPSTCRNLHWPDRHRPSDGPRRFRPAIYCADRPGRVRSQRFSVTAQPFGVTQSLGIGGQPLGITAQHVGAQRCAQSICSCHHDRYRWTASRHFFCCFPWPVDSDQYGSFPSESRSGRSCRLYD